MSPEKTINLIFSFADRGWITPEQAMAMIADHGGPRCNPDTPQPDPGSAGAQSRLDKAPEG